MKHKPTTKQKKDEPMVITLTKGQVQGIKDAPEEFMREQKNKKIKKKFMKARAKTKKEAEDIEENFAGGGLAEATAKLKAKGFNEGGSVIKDKTVAIDKSPNSGLITQRGFGASRRT